ncbi:hypothetical protein [Pseudoduganella dura]|uniref:hypothetical protein n=1 Tax=Pseudoduganella dura TaxID=321982 RepID=UPI001673A5C3|nr:hypothetical protein [Pseudoduganella dura]GGY21266.1 hypothetical protein GCM10007386_57580 [Pseudoduganella dura]
MVSIGTVQTIIVCVNGSEGNAGACPVGQVQSVTQAYVITPSEGARLDLLAEPYSSATAWSFFGFAFASTIGIWWLAHGAGEIIKMIRS